MDPRTQTDVLSWVIKSWLVGVLAALRWTDVSESGPRIVDKRGRDECDTGEK